MFLLFNGTTLQVFVTYLTGALYVHPLWFYKHQHDNRVRSRLSVACQRWWFQWRFWFVPSVAGYIRTLSLETVHTAFEWNCQMVAVSRIWCGIAAGQLYPQQSFLITLYLFSRTTWPSGFVHPCLNSVRLAQYSMFYNFSAFTRWLH